MSQTSCCPKSYWRRCNHLCVQSEGPLRHVLRALLGAFIGAVLFLGLSHNLALELKLKLSIGAVFVGVCALGGACSSFVRCSLLLTIPLMLGSSGKYYFLLLLMTQLLSGPVQNLQDNVQASALSLSCNLDLQLNNSRVLWKQAVVPFISIAQELMDSTTDLGAESLNVSKTFQTFRQDMMRQYGAERLAADANEANNTQQQLITWAMKQCEALVQTGVQRCSDWFSQMWDKCIATVPIPVLKQMLCFPMKFNFLCDILRVMTPWCSERLPVEGNTGKLWDLLNQIMSQFQQEFGASLVLEEELQQEVLDGQNVDQVFTDAVQDSLLRLSSGSEVIMEVLHVLKSLTLITTIFQAVIYLWNYQTDILFDNVYITSYFRRIESRRKTQGKLCVLPLSKPEQKRFIQPCSMRIHPQEELTLFSRVVELVSYVVLVLVLVSLDLVLFHVLEIVSRNTVTQFNVTGFHQVELKVDGDSIMARLLRRTVSAFNSSAQFDINSSNRACSMVPSVISPDVYFTCAIFVLMVALCSFFNVYSSRLRRVIASFHHPQREKKRVLFIYNLLLQDRKSSGSDRKSSGSDRKFPGARTGSAPGLRQEMFWLGQEVFQLGQESERAPQRAPTV